MRIVLFCMFVGQAFAAEYAILSNGFRVYAERHEVVGEKTRLHTKDGQIEFPTSLIVGFEQEEYKAPPAPPVEVAKASVPVAASPQAQKPLTVKELIDQAAEQTDLPKEILHSLAKAESAYRPNVVSPKGAIGVMQLMPGTAAMLEADPWDPKQNVEAGAKYLRELLIKYDGDVAKALAAYNAGPGAVDKYNGVPPYRETRSYVNRVIRDYKKQTGEID